ncbi:MAG: hypothetical protein LC808_21640, partial [Actinobacteria bacterium]|nr:hypothetical protein [Actinomycetota bacterium]
AELELEQSRRLDAIGELAGGVAHDFNNLLSVILNYTEFAKERLATDEPGRSDLEEVLEASRKGARLVKQLLAFSRQGAVAPAIFDLNEVVRDFVQLLGSGGRDDLSITTKLHPSPMLIEADPVQLGQVVVNLVQNAKEAAAPGGDIRVETLPCDEGGRLWCLLKVSDRGRGIDPEVKERMFEPFYTTKERGSGTGLGLAVVHGAVQRAGGSISVSSDADEGTTFELRFPDVAARAD